MATQKKIDTVQELTDKIAKAKSLIFADYVGLKHKQLEDLRRKMRLVDAEFVVTKNKLMERALRQAQGKLSFENLRSAFSNATATVFSYKDEVSGLKELLKFFKATNVGKTKAGMLGDVVLSDNEVIKLSKIPGREVLLGQLAGQLKAPIANLHHALSWNINKLVWALNSVKAKKTA
ncbi:MAG: 50S ribosomal protein L10 [Candidatus Gottesmanbacteria bacterium]